MSLWSPVTVLAPPAEAEQQILQAARRSFFEEEDLEKAVSLLEPGQAESHPRLRRFLARLYMAQDREGEAAAVMQAIIPVIADPGLWGLALCGCQQTRAITATGARAMFVPVPKCGSTSMTNLFAVVRGRTAAGEAILADKNQYDIVTFVDFTEAYGDYERLLCVRHPFDRLVSFYQGNIVDRDHLLVEVPGNKTHFFGLSLKPSLDDFVANLSSYRRFITTIWFHTAPLVHFAGANETLFTHIFGIKDMRAQVERLTKKFGVTFERETRDMARQSGQDVRLTDGQKARLTDLYADDISRFSRWF